MVFPCYISVSDDKADISISASIALGALGNSTMSMSNGMSMFNGTIPSANGTFNRMSPHGSSNGIHENSNLTFGLDISDLMSSDRGFIQERNVPIEDQEYLDEGDLIRIKRNSKTKSPNEETLKKTAQDMLDILQSNKTMNEKWSELQKKRLVTKPVIDAMQKRSKELRLTPEDLNCLNIYLHTSWKGCSLEFDTMSHLYPLPTYWRLIRCLYVFLGQDPKFSKLDAMGSALGHILSQNMNRTEFDHLKSMSPYNGEIHQLYKIAEQNFSPVYLKFSPDDYRRVVDGYETDDLQNKVILKSLIDEKISDGVMLRNQTRAMEITITKESDLGKPYCSILPALEIPSTKVASMFMHKMHTGDANPTNSPFKDLVNELVYHNVSSDITEPIRDAIVRDTFNAEIQNLIKRGCEVPKTSVVQQMEDTFHVCKTPKIKDNLQFYYSLLATLRLTNDPNITADFLRRVDPAMEAFRVYLKNKKGMPGFPVEDMDYVLNCLSPEWVEKNPPADLARIQKIFHGQTKIIRDDLKFLRWSSAEGEHSKARRTLHSLATKFTRNTKSKKGKTSALRQDGLELAEDILKTLKLPVGSRKEIQLLESRMKQLEERATGPTLKFCQDSDLILKKYIYNDALMADEYSTYDCVWRGLDLSKSGDELLKSYFQTFILILELDWNQWQSVLLYFTRHRKAEFGAFLRLLKEDDRFKQLGVWLEEKMSFDVSDQSFNAAQRMRLYYQQLL